MGNMKHLSVWTAKVLDGSIPVKRYRMLAGWMAIHEDELVANWKMLSEGEGFFKIEPLK